MKFTTEEYLEMKEKHNYGLLDFDMWARYCQAFLEHLLKEKEISEILKRMKEN